MSTDFNSDFKNSPSFGGVRGGFKALLFAAGLGTRLKPFTDNHPKALAKVNGKTLLERNIEYLKSYGINEFVINVHHFADQIVDFLEKNENFGVKIQISDESDEVLETGGGLVKAKDLLENQPFLVMNVDILTNLNIHQLIDFHFKHRPLVTLAVSDRKSSRKLLFEKDMWLKGWKNMATGEEIRESEFELKEMAFSGIHVIEPEFLELLPAGGKFSIMTSYMELMKSEIIMGYDHSGGILVDVGRPESVLEAEKFFL